MNKFCELYQLITNVVHWNSKRIHSLNKKTNRQSCSSCRKSKRNRVKRRSNNKERRMRRRKFLLKRNHNWEGRKGRNKGINVIKRNASYWRRRESLLENSSLSNQMREQEVFPQHLIYLLSQDFGSRGPRLNEREKIMCQAVHLHLKSTEETVWMLNCLLLQHIRRRWWWRWRWRRGLLQRKLVLLSLHSVDPLPFRRKRGLLGMMSSIPFVNLRHQNRGWKNEEQKLKN